MRTNLQRETLKDSRIYRITYTQYFPINAQNASVLAQKSGIILKEENEYRFIENYSLEEKIPYSELYKK